MAKTKNYSQSEKKRALKLYHKARDDGETAADAAEIAGLPYITLRLWERAEEQGPSKGARPIGRPRKSAGKFRLLDASGKVVAETDSAADMLKIVKKLEN